MKSQSVGTKRQRSYYTDESDESYESVRVPVETKRKLVNDNKITYDEFNKRATEIFTKFNERFIDFYFYDPTKQTSREGVFSFVQTIKSFSMNPNHSIFNRNRIPKLVEISWKYFVPVSVDIFSFCNRFLFLHFLLF